MVGTVIEGVMEEQHSWDGDQEDQDEDVEDSEGVMKLILSRLFAVWDHLSSSGGVCKGPINEHFYLYIIIKL